MFEWTSRHEYNYNKLSDSWKRIVISFSFNIQESLNINGELKIILIFIVNNPTICCKFCVLSSIFIGMDEWWGHGRKTVCVKKQDEFFEPINPYIHPETIESP